MAGRMAGHPVRLMLEVLSIALLSLIHLVILYTNKHCSNRKKTFFFFVGSVPVTLASLPAYPKQSLHSEEGIRIPAFRLLQDLEKNLRIYTLSTPKHSMPSSISYVISGLLQSLNALLDFFSSYKRKDCRAKAVQLDRNRLVIKSGIQLLPLQ